MTTFNKTQDEKPVNKEAKQTAEKLANEAHAHAKEVSRQVQREVRRTAAPQKQQAANQMSGIAQAVRQSSHALRENEQTAVVADYANTVADQIDRFSGYLENRNFSEILSDAEKMARQNPELFIGGAFTLGLMAARFFKSSAPRNQYGSYPPPPTSNLPADYRHAPVTAVPDPRRYSSPRPPRRGA